MTKRLPDGNRVGEGARSIRGCAPGPQSSDRSASEGGDVVA